MGTRLSAAAVLAFLFSTFLPGGGVAGQDLAVVMVEENLRAEPQGTIIGRIREGTSLSVRQVQGRWVQVEVQGWVWTRSLQVTDRPGFDLSVSAEEMENLRAEPSGVVLAELLEGALLRRTGEIAGWTEVSRVAWVWGPSLDIQVAEDPPEVSSRTQANPSPRPSEGGERWWRAGSAGAPILSGPDGDTLARGRSGIELEILARQGNWARVRMEGWVWAPAGAPGESVEAGTVSGLTQEDLARAPDAHLGRIVDWELQFVSLEEAERIRTDFYEGEPFLLTRALSQGRAFVYVAVPPERLAEVEGLIPLERIRVVGRIRAGAAALTGNPILDLLELTRY
jgi:hypothetical protein